MTAIHDDPSCGEKGEGLRVWKLRGTRGASMLRRTALDALLRSVIPRVLNGLSMPKRSAGTIIGLPGAAPVRSPPSSYAPRLVAYGEGCPFSAGSRGPTTGRCSALRVGARLQDTRIIRLVRGLSLFHHRSRLSVLRRFARIHRPVRFVVAGEAITESTGWPPSAALESMTPSPGDHEQQHPLSADCSEESSGPPTCVTSAGSPA